VADAGGSVAPDGTFSVSGGTWLISAEGSVGSPTSKAASGRLYGPNAEEIGGVWGMSYEDECAKLNAAGVFAGKQTGSQ
ncbi:MAG: hypothetical protein JW821_15660, partial [Deltaproteobacteria bacterium]|nr:hypothetical protein [Deltaproteobacteria bacterium]